MSVCLCVCVYVGMSVRITRQKIEKFVNIVIIINYVFKAYSYTILPPYTYTRNWKQRYWEMKRTEFSVSNSNSNVKCCFHVHWITNARNTANSEFKKEIYIKKGSNHGIPFRTWFSGFKFECECVYEYLISMLWSFWQWVDYAVKYKNIERERERKS